MAHRIKAINEMTLEEAQDALKRVRTVAGRVAREQDWCDNGVREAFDEIGIEPPGDATKWLTIRIQVKYPEHREYRDSAWEQMVTDRLDELSDEDGEDIEVTETYIVSFTDEDPEEQPGRPEVPRGRPEDKDGYVNHPGSLSRF